VAGDLSTADRRARSFLRTAVANPGAARVKLAAVRPRPPFRAAKDLPKAKSWTMISNPGLERVHQHVRDGQIRSSWTQGPATTRFEELETEITVGTAASYRVSATVPCRAECRIAHSIKISRRDGNAGISSSIVASGAGETIEASGILSVNWDGKELFRKSWKA